MNRFGWLAVSAILAFVIAASWVGCGVKSPPVPPQAARPERILDLRAASEKNGIKLTWGRPDSYESGDKMRNLATFDVMRADQNEGFRKIGVVQVTDQQRFQQQRVFTFLDRNATVGQSYSYQVTSNTDDDYESQPSNQVSLVRTVPPPPPNPENFVIPTPTPLP